MQVRTVVTGHDAKGRAVFLSTTGAALAADGGRTAI